MSKLPDAPGRSGSVASNGDNDPPSQLWRGINEGLPKPPSHGETTKYSALSAAAARSLGAGQPTLPAGPSSAATPSRVPPSPSSGYTGHNPLLSTPSSSSRLPSEPSGRLSARAVTTTGGITRHNDPTAGSLPPGVPQRTYDTRGNTVQTESRRLEGDNIARPTTTSTTKVPPYSILSPVKKQTDGTTPAAERAHVFGGAREIPTTMGERSQSPPPQHQQYQQPSSQTHQSRAPLPSSTGTARHGVSPSSVNSFQSYLSDDEFIRDLLWLWTGPETTTLFAWNKEQDRYTLSKGNIALTARQRSVFDACVCCGASCYRIKRVLGGQEGQISFLQQSLYTSLKHQVFQYTQQVGMLQENLPSIPKLLVFKGNASCRLEVLEQIVHETEKTKGGALVSKLRSLIDNGAPSIGALLTDVYSQTVMSMVKMTVQWITRGEIPDPYCEFFVHVEGGVRDDDEQFWFNKYSLRVGMVPTNFPSTLADRILRVGKNINFIRRCCRLKDWRISTGVIDLANACTLDSMEAAVNEALKQTNKAVMDVLKTQYKVHEHFAVFRYFFLMAHGDFFQSFLLRVDPILTRRSQDVSTTSLQEQLRLTLRDVTVGFPEISDPDVINNIDAVNNRQDGRLGYDTFSLVYPVTAPLNTLFNSSRVLPTYRRLFQVLWKVKHAEESLKSTWRQSSDVIRNLTRSAAHDKTKKTRKEQLKKLAADTHLLWLELNHFVTNFQSYLMYEVIMASWEKLNNNMQTADSLDDLLRMHQEYLDDLEQYTLLHEPFAEVKEIIDELLELPREFKEAHAAFVATVGMERGDLEAIRAALVNVADTYHEKMHALMSKLERQNLEYDFLNFLAFRLNFNRYYRESADSLNTSF